MEYCNINVDPEIKSGYLDQNLSRVQLKNVSILKELVRNSSSNSAEKSIKFKFSTSATDVFSSNGENFLKIRNNENQFENLKFDLLIECTGFYQKQKFFCLQQDPHGKFITSVQYNIKDNIYSCGWSRTGPKGNISDSILEASNCAKQLYLDLNS